MILEQIYLPLEEGISALLSDIFILRLLNADSQLTFCEEQLEGDLFCKLFLQNLV